MTDAMRPEDVSPALVDRAAMAVFCKFMGSTPEVWHQNGQLPDAARHHYRALARHALAAVIPLIQEAERAQLEHDANLLFLDHSGRNMGEAFAAAIVQRRIRSRGGAA